MSIRLPYFTYPVWFDVDKLTHTKVRVTGVEPGKSGWIPYCADLWVERAKFTCLSRSIEGLRKAQVTILP